MNQCVFERFCKAREPEEFYTAFMELQEMMSQQEDPIIWLLTSFEEYLGGKIDDRTIMKLNRAFHLRDEHSEKYWEWRHAYLHRRRVEFMAQLGK